jgi:hypothetical protein
MITNFMETFEKPIKVFKLFMLWPEGTPSKLRLVTILALRVIFVEIYLILAVIFLMKVESIEEFSKSIGVTPMYIVSVFKSINFLVNREKIHQLYQDLKSLVEDSSWIQKQKGLKLTQRITQITRIFKIFLSFSMYGVTMSAFVAFVEHELPLKMWFPYDYKSNEALFWLSAIYQITGGYFMTPITVLIEVFPIFIISYLTGIVEDLCERLEKIGDKKKRVKFEIKTVETLENLENYNELVNCVKIHQKIVEMTSSLNEIFGKDFWFQGFISIFVLCTTSFSLTIVSGKSIEFRSYISLFFLL